MVDIYLNYDKLVAAYKKYIDIKNKKNAWFDANMDILLQMAPGNAGSWHNMYNLQALSINNDLINFSNDINSFCTMFNKADDLSCKLLNRVYAFDDILTGTEPEEDYPICFMAGSGKDLFYSSDHYSDIRCTNTEITECYESEVAQLDSIDEYASYFTWLSPGCLSAETSTVRTSIDPEKYIDKFDKSFEKYASEVASFNETIGALLAALAGDVTGLELVERDYTFDSTGLTDKQKSEIWFAEFIDDDYKKYYVDLSEYDTYIQEVYQVYVNASGPAKDLFDHYRGKIIIKTMEVSSGISYHNGGYLYIAGKDDINDPRGKGSTFYHETGHLIVYETGALKSAEMKAFEEALQREVGAYVESIEVQMRNQYVNSGLSSEDIEKLVQRDTEAFLRQELTGTNNADFHVYDGVSDMIDAATNHKYSITYSHERSDPDYWFIPFYDPTYWEADTSRQCNEAFAEIFAAEMSGDQQEINFIKTNFGDVYDRYKDVCAYMEATKQ